MPQTFIEHLEFDSFLIQVHRKKNIKRLSLKMDPRHGLSLNAPSFVSHDIILNFIEASKPWIHKHYRPIISKNYTHGEKHFYLGREYPLNVLDYSGKSQVVLDEEKINVYLKNPNENSIQKALLEFYRKEAQILFPERLRLCMQKTPWVKKIPTLRLSYMRSRFGSCSSLGNISLNLYLMKNSVELIDYVIFHELCHIQEQNHGPRFYALMNQVLPHWKDLKKQLKLLIH
jgi:predicted metal-dependent hydrolase